MLSHWLRARRSKPEVILCRSLLWYLKDTILKGTMKLQPSLQIPHQTRWRTQRAARVMIFLLLLVAMTACTVDALPAPDSTGEELPALPTPIEGVPQPTALPERPQYGPGELVEYIAQTGDTLPALAVRFNTTEREIRAANPVIPLDATTMPPGMPMRIPIYYEPLWGTPYQIIPDSLFVNGPAQVGFDAEAFVREQPGWFKFYHRYVNGEERYGGELIDNIAINYSVSPRLLLAILEYQTGALSQAQVPDPEPRYPLGHLNARDQGYYSQLVWAANTLNNGYYGWRAGTLTEFEHFDGRIERPDPWQNAGTVALQYYFSLVLRNRDAFTQAIHAQGLEATYLRLFGDPWENVQAHIPVSLTQPALSFPFPTGKTWSFTGGPHTNWGTGMPYTALDFAPPANATGCAISEDWATAMADGVIARTGNALAELDLDGDGDIRTGWVIYYLHLANDGLIRQGARVKAGDPLGHPSCEGGNATGTHVHIARKYNGEWIPAGGVLAFDLEGWIAREGGEPYQGTLTHFSETATANTSGDSTTLVHSQPAPIQ